MTGALPLALLCAALGLALGFASLRQIAAALAALVVAAVLASLLPANDHVMTGLWLSTAISAASVHLRRRPAALPLLLGLNAGGWAGAAAGGTPDLLRALPVALVALPAAWLVAQHWELAVKVAASWLIAVAILAATLPIVTTPGYVADHRG